MRKRDGGVNRILLFFGGSDPSNETAKAIDAIKILNRPEISVDVIVGGANPSREQLQQKCLSMPNTRFHAQVENMAELINDADLAIGAGGTSTWERCCLRTSQHDYSNRIEPGSACVAFTQQGWALLLRNRKEYDQRRYC